MIEYETISSKDLIILRADVEKIDTDNIRDSFKALQKLFPNNDIIFMPEGMDLEIIHREGNMFL